MSRKLNRGEMTISVTHTLRVSELTSALALSPWEGHQASAHEVLSLVRQSVMLHGVLVSQRWEATLHEYRGRKDHDAAAKWTARWNAARRLILMRLTPTD